MQVKRSDRVAGLLQREISNIMFREIKDPSLRLVTITKVKLTDDLKLAKIYVNALRDSVEMETVLKGLERAKNFIRGELGHRTALRYVPELKFFYDDTLDYAASINSLIQRIQTEDKR